MQAGERVAHFEILSVLGRGGMGEVFRARDTKLERDVALKTLPPELASDPARVSRLQREATALAALNHPHIASIYGIEEQDGARFLVLELVDGGTLEERLLKGRLSVEQALKIAVQIASAVEAAHDKGVVHRDLKPSNVKITPDGVVKVLDFGLAKNVSASTPAAAETALRTEIGVVMGTPQYMSPEQARGESAGTQSDIWSFGVILYEMLAGAAPFRHDTIPGTLARVLEAEPDFTKLPKDTPPSVRRLLRRCLEKDLKRRMRHIGDVRVEIEDVLAGGGASDEEGRAHSAPRFRAALLGTGLGGAAVAAVAAWFLADRSTPVPAAEPVRLSIPALEAAVPLPLGTQHLAITADGQRVAYTTGRRIWVRELGAAEPVAIDTQGVNPFFSPDGEWIGLYGVDSGLWKVPSRGGAPALLFRDSERSLGAAWGADGTIVFANTVGLFRVSEDGGTPELLARPDAARGERAYAWPSLLPDGRFVLFTVLKGESLASAEAASLDLRTREVRTVLPGAAAARYAASGHLVYLAGPTTQAVAFDADTRTMRGAPVPLPDTAVAFAGDNVAAELALSANGTLVYAAPRQGVLRSLVWVDREGNEEPVPIAPGWYTYPRVSPDGTLVALDVAGASNRDIWILDLRRSTLTRLTTSPGEDMTPVWSVDGRRVFFSSNRTGNVDLYSQAADGATEAKLEAGGELFHLPNSFTPDGSRLILYEEFRDLTVLDLATSEVRPLLNGTFDERLGEVSPDGTALAYESDESGGQIEIFVRPFPTVTSAREKVSLNGGRYPRWGRAGSNELYYVDPEGGVMAAALELSPAPRVLRVTKLFDWEKPPVLRSARPYDISPIDGRFLMIKSNPAAAADTAEISVVLNWFTELRRLAPAK